MGAKTLTVRLVFVDEGSYHHEDVSVAASVVGKYDRLIDAIREDESVLRHLYVDVSRLASAYVVE